MREVRIETESWPARGVFAISRGSKTAADVVVVELVDTVGDGRTGRGECVPYPRYGESIEGVVAQIESVVEPLREGMSREELQDQLPPGAARNAVDCALWDLESKLTGVPVWQMAELSEPTPVVTAFTISLDTPDAMAEAAADADAPILKCKLGGEADDERMRAVRYAAPAARLLVDANEAWTLDDLTTWAPVAAGLGVEVIEQPLPAADDSALEGFDSPVPLCADESVHDRASLDDLAGRYDLVNIKLDKTGGLTEAIVLLREARRRKLGVCVGCMLSTSLSIAPAALLATGADHVDLDGPLLLERDRVPGLHFDGTTLDPVNRELWG